MSDNREGNLRISGTGYTGGGSFDKVSVSGAGKVKGDLDCNSFHISGSCDVTGNVITDSGKVSGAASISGSLEADEFKVSGSLATSGDASIKDLNISGEMKTSGNYKSDSIHVWGVLSAGGNTEAEDFMVNGLFKIGGMLNADRIDVTLSHSVSSAKEIGGGQITIKQSPFTAGITNLIKSFFSMPLQSRLEAESIEGDEIYLECTKASVVRGSKVTLGPGCEIGLVEYRDTYRADPDSKVTEDRKI